MMDTCAQSSRTWRQVAEEILNEGDQQKAQILMEELFGLLEDRTKKTRRPVPAAEHAA